MRAKPLNEEQKSIIRSLKTRLKTNSEIAEKAKCTVWQVKDFCQKEQITYNPNEMNALKQKTQSMNEGEISIRVFQRSKGAFQYYGNYERNGGEFKCDIQCTKCNAVKSVSSCTIRSWRKEKNPCCSNCIELKKQEEEKRKLIKKLCKNLKFALKKKRNEQTFTKTCECCGNVFETPYETQLVCGNICRSKKKHLKWKKYHKDDRYKRFGIKENPNINAKSVYKRDDGMCWICHTICDLNDYIENETGTIICGNNYPSVDHIVPISKGGTDTWDNVKCAHRICNSLRAANE